MNTLPTPVSFDIALEKFVTYLKTQRRSSATVIAYNSDLIQLKKHFAERRITQVTTLVSQHLQDYLLSLSSNGYTAKSVSRKINSLKTFFKFLNQNNLTPTNPASELAHPKYESSAPRILTPAEYSSLRDAVRLDIRMSAVVELLLQTGMRISELANLHTEDIKKTEVYIRPQENNAGRTVPLNKYVSTAVANYLAIRPSVTDPHLFVTKTGHPLLIRNIRTAIDRFFRVADVKGTKVNDLRHTFMAHQLSAGCDPQYLSQIVGHKRLTSTTKYLDFIKPCSGPLTTRLVEL
ncbi:MAG: Tyrosine recombinase XerC [Candidatus Amesbacteria bacterium GW2011_GWA2_47_11b]|uniref:Tyrosine recombinase XerC n=1 Tax=Candidatus Amesbacteria bacterium GW2011_GWA2_47_11b TaxID=1618358 RepID=A0A0G1RID2_9BACT|nr:MAG: Tyrosine recombinase XerC [Candidatus Amesbacteria bacterium GW2011_GWA2_47_11b]